MQPCATYHLSAGTYADMAAWRLSSIPSKAAGVSTTATKPEILMLILLTKSQKRLRVCSLNFFEKFSKKNLNLCLQGGAF